MYLFETSFKKVLDQAYIDFNHICKKIEETNKIATDDPGHYFSLMLEEHVQSCDTENFLYDCIHHFEKVQAGMKEELEEAKPDFGLLRIEMLKFFSDCIEHLRKVACEPLKVTDNRSMNFMNEAHSNNIQAKLAYLDKYYGLFTEPVKL